MLCTKEHTALLRCPSRSCGARVLPADGVSLDTSFKCDACSSPFHYGVCLHCDRVDIHGGSNSSCKTACKRCSKAMVCDSEMLHTCPRCDTAVDPAGGVEHGCTYECNKCEVFYHFSVCLGCERKNIHDGHHRRCSKTCGKCGCVTRSQGLCWLTRPDARG